MGTTAENLTAALELMKTEGRGMGGLHVSQEIVDVNPNNTYKIGYCPLGAISKARGGATHGLAYEAYEDTSEALAVADAIYELYTEGDYENYTSYVERRGHEMVHEWNDETTDDEKVFAVMAKAIENAKKLVDA